MLFDSQMDITTVKVYTKVGKQLMRYIFRPKDVELKKRPAYKLTERQQMCIKDVQTSIEELVGWKEEQMGDSESRKEGEGDEELDEEIEQMGRIQQKILRLWIALLNQPITRR